MSYTHMAVVFSLLLWASSPTRADTWQGGGGNQNISNPANWADGTVFDGDVGRQDMVFPAGVGFVSPVVDANVTNVRNITFEADAPAFAIGAANGGSIGFNPTPTNQAFLLSYIINNSTNEQVFNVPLDVPYTLYLHPIAGDLTFNGPINITSFLATSGIEGSPNGIVTFNGEISGPGNIFLSRIDGVVLPNANTLSGRWEVDDPTTLWIGHDQAFGTGSIQFEDDTVLEATGGARNFENPVVSIRGSDPKISLMGDHDITFTGQLRVVPTQREFTLAAAAGRMLTFTGDVVGLSNSTQALIKVDGPGTVRLDGRVGFTGFMGFEVNGGTLDLRDTFFIKLNGGNSSVNDGGTLMGTGIAAGTVTVNNGGRISPGASIGTLTVKALNLNTGATLAVEIDKGADGQVADLLTVTATAALSAGSIVDVAVIGDPLEIGDLFTVLTAVTLNVDAELPTVTAPDGYDIIGQTNGNDYELLVQDVPAQEGGFAGRLANSVNPRVGVALDRLRDTAPNHPLIAILDDASDAQLLRFVRDFDRGVETPRVFRDISTRTVRVFNQLLSSYLSLARNGTTGFAMNTGRAGSMLADLDVEGAALGYAISAMYARDDETSSTYQPLLPRRTTEWSAYAKVYGAYSNQDDYAADTYGVQAGLDRQFGDHWIAGITLGYTNTDANLAGNVGGVETDTLRVGPYATYEGDGGRWFIDLAATYGYHKTDAERIAAGVSADADYDSHDITLYIGGGYNLRPTDNLRITPIASLQYQYFYRDDYTETGTGAISMDSADTNTLYSRLGVQIGYRIDVGSIILVPEFTVGWEHEWLDENETIDASFVGGGAFTIDSTAPEQDSVFYGAGLTARLSDTTSLFARYEGTSNSGGDVHGFEAGIRLWF